MPNKFKHYAYRTDDPIEIHVNIDVKPEDDPCTTFDGKPIPNAILIYEGDDTDELIAACEPWFKYYQDLDNERRGEEYDPTIPKYDIRPKP